MRHLTRELLPGVLVLVSACTSLFHDRPAGLSPAIGGSYDGPECQALCEHGYLESAAIEVDHVIGGRQVVQTCRRDASGSFHAEGGATNYQGHRGPKMSELEAATLVACAANTQMVGYATDKTKLTATVADHLTFDDRHFDHLKAAVMVMDCALNEACGAEEMPGAIGLIASYARRVDPHAAVAALTAAGGSPGLRAAFASKLDWALAAVGGRAGVLDPRRKALWRDIPEQVWTERAEYFRTWHELYAALDPLRAVAESGQGDLDRAARAVRELRGKYLAACKVEGCLFTPFVLETTRTLELLAVRMQDVPAALAERQLLDDKRLRAQSFAFAVLVALTPPSKRETAAYEKYEHAKNSGAGDAALQTMFGPAAPIRVSQENSPLDWREPPETNLTQGLATEAASRASGNVREVKRAGATATVVFADEVTTWEDEDCHDTDKIDGIDRHTGKLIYRQECRSLGTKVDRQKVPPITVPSEEAATLRSGESVRAWVSPDRRGAIVSVDDKGRLVQVRGHRLRANERSLGDL